MKLKRIFAVHLIVLALVFPHAVCAEDFTFDLKLELSNLHPDVAKIRLYCGASISDAGGMIGDGDLEIDVPPAGGINNTVQLTFNASPGKKLSDAKVWRCDAYFFKQGDNTQSYPRNSTSGECQNSANDWRCAKPGTPFSMIIAGSLTKSQ
jgi:hypothetical protein